MAKRLLAFISAPFISISRVICLDAGSSTRLPGVCPVSGPRRTHARVRRRREPDAKRFNATLMTRNSSETQCGFLAERRADPGS